MVYDGCPKSFDAGIWWPKTKFGRPAAMDCPKGSVGVYLIIPLLIKATCGVIIQLSVQSNVVWSSSNRDQKGFGPLMSLYQGKC